MRKYCICVGKVNNPKPACADCLVANDIYFGCGQGLKPCVGTTTVDLKVYNPSNPAGTVYTVIKKDEPAFTSATINGSGVLSVTAGLAYDKDKMFGVMYKATFEGKSDLGIISFCFDNPCDTGCTKCNWCNGDCYTQIDFEEETECGGTGTIDLQDVVNVTACNGTNTYKVTTKSTSIGVLSVNGSGVVSYGMTSPAAVGDHIIDYRIDCNKYGLFIEGQLKLTVPDLCSGQEVDDDEMCDPCTGDIIELESDLTGSIGGSSGSGGSISGSIG